MKYIYIILCILITLCSFAEAKETEDDLTDREKMMKAARQRAKEKEEARKAAKKEGLKYKPGAVCYIGEEVTYAFYNHKLAQRYALAQECSFSGSSGSDGDNNNETCEKILASADKKFVQYKKGNKVKIKAVKGNVAVIQKGKTVLFLPVSDLMTQSEYKAFSVREGYGWTDGLPDDWKLLNKGDFITVKGKLYGFKYQSDAKAYGELLAHNQLKAQKYVDFLLRKKYAIVYSKGTELVVEDVYYASYTELPDMIKRCARCTPAVGDGDSMYISECEYAINVQLSIPEAKLKKKAELRKQAEREALLARQGEGWTDGLPNDWTSLEEGDCITIKGKTYGFEYSSDAETYGLILSKDYEKAQIYVKKLLKDKKAIIYNEGVELVVKSVRNSYCKELPEKAKRNAECVKLNGDDTKSRYISECEYAINQQLHK